MMAGIAVTAAEPSGLWGLLKESFASGSALVSAKMDPGSNQLIKAVVADFDTADGRNITRDGLKKELTGSKPSEIKPGRSYELTGKVVNGSISHRGDSLRFRVRDRDGTASVPVTYTGVVPDPFRDGREVIVSGELHNGTFVGERDSLVTKCPSKFTKDQNAS